MKFLEYLTTGKPQPAIALAAAITEAEAERAALGPLLEQLAERRRVALLAADDGPVDGIEAEQIKTARNLDRLDASLDELRRRHSEAQQRERAEHVERTYQRAVECQSKAADLLRQYAAEAEKLAAILSAIVELDAERCRLNQALDAADDPRRADDPEAMIAATGQYRGNTPARVLLPSPLDPQRTIWPLAPVAAAARERVAA